MKALILRLDATMMSFGTVLIDQHGFIDRFPGTSLLCGLIANAIGWDHGDFERLQSLQGRIEYAARWDVPPRRIVDYHTVDMSQRKMIGPSWTTRGMPEEHGSNKPLTHQRYRHYWEDGLMTVALTLHGDLPPSLDIVRKRLERPARPLFFGRKCCIPSRPLLDPTTPVVDGDDVVAILRRIPVWDRHGNPVAEPVAREACWPGRLSSRYPGDLLRVADTRDWANQIPAGSTLRAVALLTAEV